MPQTRGKLAASLLAALVLTSVALWGTSTPTSGGPPAWNPQEPASHGSTGGRGVTVLPPGSLQRGSIDGGDRQVFWFLHVSDTQGLWRHPGQIPLWERFLGESFHTIQPLFVVNTGDLVDSDYYDFFERGVGQEHWEWYSYQKSLDDAQMNFSVYKDLLGNHDMYRDIAAAFYLNYSMAGRAIGRTQYSWNFTNSLGTFAFLGLNTPEDNGIEYPFALFGYLNRSELDWYEAELRSYRGAQMTMIFGHHPPYEVVSSLSSSGATWGRLNREFGVDAYFVGHGHINDVEDARGMPAIETGKFDGDAPYRVVAVDGTTLSSRAFTVGEWPQALITSPAQVDHLYADYDRAQLVNVDAVRVLAWDPKGVSRVRVQVPGGEWADATNVGGPLWELPTDAPVASGVVKAKVTGGSGETVVDLEFLQSPGWHWTWFQGAIFLTVAFLGIQIALPVTVAVLRLKYPKRFGKKPGRNVDPRQRRTFLLKCLVFLLVPLTVGLMLFESPTLVFSLFYLNSRGAFFYSTNLIYTSIPFLFGILVPSFFLSPVNRKKMVAASVGSIASELFLLVFYLLRFPAVSWIAPGYYLLIACDVLLAWRALEPGKKTRPCNAQA
ncbi:MAG: metallophosphoesterase family protein [Promethearchaeota archaeon]